MPLQARYLSDYFRAFDRNVTRHQMAEPFAHIGQAADYFHACWLREQARLSFIRIAVTPEDELLGSVEAHNLWGDTPKLGLWISAAHQGKGYGAEALCTLLDFLRGQGYVRFAYETDCANLPSVRLAQRLGGTVVRREEVRTESGKRLQLDLYEID